MKGYKTYISAAIVGISAAMKYLGYAEELAEFLTLFGSAGIAAGFRAAMK